MTIKAGEKMPSGTFGVMTDSGPGAMTADELFSGKKVVLIGVPGAFTPICSHDHLPSLIASADQLKEMGAKEIYCISDDNPWAIDSWRQTLAARCGRAVAMSWFATQSSSGKSCRLSCLIRR